MKHILNELSQPLLPCNELLEQQAAEEEKNTALQETQSEIEHPLLTVMRDIKPENITPIEAINLITEWKKLWT